MTSPTSSRSLEPEQRRAHSRTPLEVEVTLESEHNFFNGFTDNISEGGVFVATHRLLEVGVQLSLELALPGCAAPMRIQGTVRWIRLYGESSDAPPGIGIEFVDLSSEDATTIQEFCARRDPLFWVDS